MTHITVHDAHNGRKEGNVLCNDALNTFYLQIYGIRHVVTDHPYRERGNLLPPQGYSFRLTAIFYMHHPTDRIAHTTAFVTPVVEHCLEGQIAQWVHPMKDRSDDPSHHEQTLLPRSYISLHNCCNDTYNLLQVTPAVFSGGNVNLFLVIALPLQWLHLLPCEVWCSSLTEEFFKARLLREMFNLRLPLTVG